MGLSQLNLWGKNKIEVAIDRIQAHAKGVLFFADSYGKDSCVTRSLLFESGVLFETHHSKTGIDAPELYKFGEKYHPETIIHLPVMSMWKAMMLRENGLPGRQFRWCCGVLKEDKGSGRIVVTGVRWQESPGRRGNRRLFELCQKDSTKWFLNPIIDWTEKEVWEYIYSREIPYCSLYDEVDSSGKPLFKRLGCILCPMGSAKQAQLQLQRWPKIGEAWHRATLRLFAMYPERFGKHYKSGEDMWIRWLSRKGEPKINQAQCTMFDN